MPRVNVTRMTEQQGQTISGKRLLNIIVDICQDERIELSEVKELHHFLAADRSGMIAIQQLHVLTSEAIADDEIDEVDAYRLKTAFVKLAPPSVRGVIETHLESIGYPFWSDDDLEEPAWKRHPATKKQLDFIRNLGGYAPDHATKGEAAMAIDVLLNDRPVTPRQMMLLRFFDHLELAASSKDEVSEWIDNFYGSDDRYERAWDRFKRHTNHDPYSQDPSVVPIGAYKQYLEPERRYGPDKESMRNIVYAQVDKNKGGCFSVILAAVFVIGASAYAMTLLNVAA